MATAGDMVALPIDLDSLDDGPPLPPPGKVPTGSPDTTTPEPQTGLVFRSECVVVELGLPATAAIVGYAA